MDIRSIRRMSSRSGSSSNDKTGTDEKLNQLINQVAALEATISKLNPNNGNRKDPSSSSFVPSEGTDSSSGGSSGSGGGTALTAANEADGMENVSYGHRVSFSHQYKSQIGYLNGDLTLRRCGVQMVPEENNERGLPTTSLHFGENVFAILPMMSYRGRAEVRKFNKNALKQKKNSVLESGDAKAAGNDTDNIDESKKAKKRKEKKILDDRAKKEEEDNAELLASTLAGEGGVIKYGDIVQLLQMETELYVKLHKKTALMDKDCRLITLRHGSPGCHFKLMPLYKTRAIGSPVFYDDEVVFESVLHEGLKLGVSHGKEAMYPSAWKWNGNAKLNLPQILRCEDMTEVNGCPDKVSFVVKRYAKFSPGVQSLRTDSMFRIFHPVADGMVWASCDPDKRRFLRPGKREDGSEAHSLYLKKLEVPDPSHPANRRAKSVWMFENVDRSTGSEIRWEESMRLRHISGKYLCVDTSVKTSGADFPELVEGISVYPCSLVEEPGEGAVFTVVPNDSSEGTLPNAPTTLRLVHEFVSGTGDHSKLYLHHIPMPRPIFAPLDSNSAIEASQNDSFGSEHICFIDASRPQGILRILPLDSEETSALKRLSRVAKSLKLYTYLMENGDVDEGGRLNKLPENAKELEKWKRFSHDAIDLVETVAGVLLEIIQSMIAGDTQLILQRSTQEWLKLATDNLPAKFSKFFSGEPNSYMQRAACDMKVIDACFEVSLAAYNRYVKIKGSGKSPFEPLVAQKYLNVDDEEKFENMDANQRTPAQFISKLSHVCLQRLFCNSTQNQQYFAKRESLMLNKEEPTKDVEPSSWVSIISSQSEDPLGATVTLSALLTSNERISTQIVDDHLLTRFLTLIKNNGPQPRLIQLFSSVCICAGKAITGNQEMVLRKIWKDKAARKDSLLSVVEMSGVQRERYGSVKGPSTTISDRENFLDDKAPGNFLGIQSLTANKQIGGFKPVYVKWSGNNAWQQGSDDLFWDWKGLGLPESSGSSTSEQGLSQVPIEWLCYVLEPQRLCKPVTGKEHVVFNEETADESDIQAHQVYMRHCQLADYFVAELTLITNMAKGRSYNCISWLTNEAEGGFTYTMLIGMASNPWLPYSIRSSTIFLLLALYVDRYPQLARSGRPALPEILWVSENGDDIAMTSAKVAPRIRNITINDESALPRFSLSDAHAFSKSKDPVLGSRDEFKFYLLRRVTNDLIESFGGSMILSNCDENNLACAALNASSMLLNFGFQSSVKKLKALLQPSARILDGRSDEETPGQLYTPASGRFLDNGSANYQATVTAKNKVIQLLSDVSDYRANYRLGRLLTSCRDLYSSESNEVELQINAFYADPQQNMDSPIISKVLIEFEKMFTLPITAQNDAMTLDLAEITGQPIGDILLDCLMYDDDELFENALKLLGKHDPDLLVFMLLVWSNCEFCFHRPAIRTASKASRSCTKCIPS